MPPSPLLDQLNRAYFRARRDRIRSDDLESIARDRAVEATREFDRARAVARAGLVAYRSARDTYRDLLVIELPGGFHNLDGQVVTLQPDGLGLKVEPEGYPETEAG